MNFLETTNTPIVSVFEKGHLDKKGKAVPSSIKYKDVDLYRIFLFITGNYAKQATEDLRKISDHIEAQAFKALNFYAMTPAGKFSYRKANCLVQHSQLMVIDIDGIASHKRLLEVRDLLLHDGIFETEMLFIGPSGNGLKWIICVGEHTKESHSIFFNKIIGYLEKRYGIIADKSGSDVSRICYLPYDPDCYINPEFLPDNFKDQPL